MHYSTFVTAFASLVAVGQAIESPQYTGYTRQFQATFIGSANTLPSTANWNIITGDRNDNNELQTYTSSSNNLRFSGSGTLQILPRRDASATRGWTSARIESKFTISPPAGKITRIESSLRLAGNPQKNKQGLWPAFWLMNEKFRSGGVAWPACGELDIFENINGQPLNYAVAHCDKYPGGICNEPNGLVATTSLPDNQFHLWRLEIDRRNSDFKQQSLTWYKDGVQFHRITGSQINNSGVWATLAQQPLYYIMNMAVGGNWPGSPNADTWDGTGSMMEVQYIAHYTSN